MKVAENACKAQVDVSQDIGWEKYEMSTTEQIVSSQCITLSYSSEINLVLYPQRVSLPLKKTL
jgi:hypothetical protein